MWIKINMKCTGEYVNLDKYTTIEFNDKDTINALYGEIEYDDVNVQGFQNYRELFIGTEEECRQALEGLEIAICNGENYFDITQYWNENNS